MAKSNFAEFDQEIKRAGLAERVDEASKAIPHVLLMIKYETISQPSSPQAIPFL